MLDLNPITLQQVAEKAATDASQYPRWLAAIARAIVELNDNPYVCRNPNGHGLIIGSTSGECYSSNGTCSCAAYQHGQPCYHRAMARLCRLVDEREAAQLVTMPEGDALDTDGMRVARKIAAARATAILNECFA